MRRNSLLAKKLGTVLTKMLMISWQISKECPVIFNLAKIPPSVASGTSPVE